MTTENNQALVVRELSLPTWQTITAVAPTMHASRLFGVSSPEQAAAIMLKGFELGLGLTASFEFVQVVLGKPTLSPRGALAILMRSGELAGFKLDLDDQHCTVWMKRRNGFEHSETFTIDDAKRAGLVKPGGAWEAYPKNMLKWRAIGFTIDTLFSDVVGGMKRADEFGADVDLQGNVVESWTPAAQPSQAEAPIDGEVREIPAEAVTLQSLVDKYGPDKVMEAAGGRIPGTLEEVAAAQSKLEAEDVPF